MHRRNTLLLSLVCLCSFLALSSAGRRTCYGNVDNLSPGMSGSSISWDMSALRQLKSCMDSVADQYCIQASLIAAIASRESRAGRLIRNTNGYGDGGRGYGIMQCDLHTSGLPCRDCMPFSCCHIRMMVGRRLIPDINSVGRRHRNWSQDQKLQGGVAAYNFGVSNVRSWGNLDQGTTGNNYSADVIARAKYLRSRGWD